MLITIEEVLRETLALPGSADVSVGSTTAIIVLYAEAPRTPDAVATAIVDELANKNCLGG